MGPNGVHSLLCEMHTLRFNTVQLQYLEALFDLVHSTSFAPGEFFMFSVVLAPNDMNVTESAQVIVYLTTDVPRTRPYSVNYTNTLHVRFQLEAVCLHM
jgi:hypothetical protein